MSDIRLLVTGGSGFIGTMAVSHALQRGFKVRNFDIKSPNEKTHSIYWEKIDIREREAFITAIREYGPTHILHLAAKTGMDLVSMDELTANTDGVQNLIDGASGVPHLKRVLFTSSLLVCKNGYVPKGAEEYCPPNLYGRSKMIGEQIVRKSKPTFEWVIVRPTSIWGPWFEHSYKTFFQVINKGLYFHPGKDDQPKPKSYVGNTAYMMLSLLLGERESVNQKVFYLSDWPIGNTREWANTINKLLGKRDILTVPLPVLKAAAHVGDVAKALGMDPPISTFRLNNMLTGGVYPTEDTEDVVGRLPYSLEEGCRETIDWMKSQNLL